VTTQTPAAHARLSPSGSKRWFACPGSLTLEAPIPNKSSEYSDDGTAMHDIAARVLTGYLMCAADAIGTWVTVSRPDEEPTRKVQIDEDMADLVQAYVEMVLAKASGHELHVEQRVEFSQFVGLEDQFGTADFIIIERDDAGRMHTLDVGDLKTGHKPVDVEHNSQALTYALGALGDMYERAMTAEALVACGKILDAQPVLQEGRMVYPDSFEEDDDDLAG